MFASPRLGRPRRLGPGRVILSEGAGGCAACDDCRRVIEADNREVLLRRRAEKFVQFFGQALPGLAEELRRITIGPSLTVVALGTGWPGVPDASRRPERRAAFSKC